MRVNLDTKHFTKAERRFFEILKKHHIKFSTKVRISGKEVDFLIGDIAVEIGDHSQDPLKNKVLGEAGYSLLFITNKELRDQPEKVERHLLINWLKI